MEREWSSAGLPQIKTKLLKFKGADCMSRDIVTLAKYISQNAKKQIHFPLYVTLNLCVCFQSLCGNERLHGGPQGPVHQHLHVYTLPAPASPVQLCRPVWPVGPPAPQPLPTIPPAGAAAGGGRGPGPPGHPDAHRRWVSQSIHSDCLFHLQKYFKKFCIVLIYYCHNSDKCF